MSSNCQSQSHIPLGFPPELLEAILLHVDERTLLVSAQRVSQHWRDVIAASPRLQQRLFLRPDNSAAAARTSRLNPLLVRAFPFCFEDLWRRCHRRRRDDNNNNSQITYLKSNLLAARSPVWEVRYCSPMFPLSMWSGLWAAPEAFGRPRASWRRMLLHQPPVVVDELMTRMHNERVLSVTPIEKPFGPALPMQDLMLSILREFRPLYHGETITNANDTNSSSSSSSSSSSEEDPVEEDDNPDRLPHVAGFRVTWHLEEPGVPTRPRAVAEEENEPG